MQAQSTEGGCMTNVIDHLYWKTLEREHDMKMREWDRRYAAVKRCAPESFVAAIGGPQTYMDESLRHILTRMAHDIAELQKERQ
jgi:hypothetical protein